MTDRRVTARVRIAKSARHSVIAGLCLALGACATSGPEEAGTDRRAPSSTSLDDFADRDADFFYLIGRDHELEGRHEKAIAAYEAALERDPDAAGIHHKLSEVLASRGRIETAEEHARRALELDPENSRYRRFLGTLFRLQRDTPIEEAEAVLLGDDGQPVDFDAGLLLFGLYGDRGQHEASLETAKWLVANDPENLRAHFALARVYQRLERFAEAEQTLEGAFSIEPDSLVVYSLLARFHRDRDDRASEIAVLDKALGAHPGNHRLLADRVEAQVATDDFDGARETLREIEGRYPRDLSSIARLGYLEFEAERYDEATERFLRVLAADSSQHQITYVLGLTYRRQTRMDAADAAFRSIPADHERYADSRTQLASMFEEQADYVRAIEEVREAMKAAPSRPLDFFYSSLLARSGDFDGAVAFLQGLRDAEPQDIEVIYNLGVIFGDARRADEALTYMEEVLERSPMHPGALNYVGYTWAERGVRLDEAEEMILRALEQRPDDGFITDSLGWVYYMRARPFFESGERIRGREMLEQAIRELRRAAELTGGDPVISEHLGDAYLLLEEHESALRFFKEAVEMGPRDAEQPALIEKLDKLRKEMGVP